MINMNSSKEIARNPGAWASLLALTPGTAAFLVAAGLITVFAMDFFKERKEKEPLPTVGTPPAIAPQPLKQPLQNTSATAATTVRSYSGNAVPTVKPAVDPLKKEASEKEMLRKIMSDLGKKSAAARARKRVHNSNSHTTQPESF